MMHHCGFCRTIRKPKFNFVTGVTAYEICADCWNCWQYLKDNADMTAIDFAQLWPNREEVR